MNQQALRKIRFDLRDAPNREELPEELAGETVWAEPVGDGLYRLRNSPAFANGYADGDTVECAIDPETGWLEVVRLVNDGHNGTVRVYFKDSSSADAQVVIDELKSVGCNFERASTALVLFVVPPTMEIPFTQLLNYLDSVVDGDAVIGWDVGKPPSEIDRSELH